MAKHTIREEKICLNCGAEVLDKFCPACGQQNIDPTLSIKDLLNDLIHDLTHFDGKFFSTVKLLIQKPGFLTTEFIAGKRSSYLHPVRMYVFTSALFFFLFYSLFVTVPEKKSDIVNAMSKEELFDKYNQFHKDTTHLKLTQGFIISNKADTLYNLNDVDQFTELKDTIASMNDVIFKLDAEDSSSLYTDSTFETEEDYEKYEKSLPDSAKAGLMESFWQRKTIRAKQYFKKDLEDAWVEQLSRFIHSFPTLLFISLPLLALVLKLFFFRRKNLGYAVHGVFLLHLYVFSFIALLFYFIVAKLISFIHMNVSGIVGFAVFIGVILYGYKALKNFYGLQRAKALGYYFSFLVFALISMFLLFLFYLLFILLKL